MPALEPPPPREPLCCHATPSPAAAAASSSPTTSSWPPIPPSISPSSTSHHQHPLLLSPRGICRTWKEMKSRALIHTGMSLTFLEMVATSPVASLLPSLPPYSPRSPSSLLLHKRCFVQQQHISPKLHRAIANASDSSSIGAAASSQIDASSPSHDKYTQPAVRIIIKSISSLQSDNSVRRLTPSEALFICVAWMMWLWGRFVCRLYCLLLWWRMYLPHFSSSSKNATTASGVGTSSSTFVHKAKKEDTTVMDAKASGSMRSWKAVHGSSSSSSDLLRTTIAESALPKRSGRRAAKLRSSFKGLSVQIPRSRSYCNSNNNPCSISPFPPHATCISPHSPLSRMAVSSPLSISSSHKPFLIPANSCCCCSGISVTTTSSSTSPPSPSGSSAPVTPAQSAFIIGFDREKPSPPPSRDLLLLHYLAAPITLLLALTGLIFGKVISTGIVICWLLFLRLLWMLYPMFQINGSSRSRGAYPQTHPSMQ